MTSSTRATTTNAILDATASSGKTKSNDSAGVTTPPATTIVGSGSSGMKRWHGKRRGQSLDDSPFAFGTELRVLTQLQSTSSSKQPPMTAPSHGHGYGKHFGTHPSCRSWSFSPHRTTHATTTDPSSSRSNGVSTSASPSPSVKGKKKKKSKVKAKAKATDPPEDEAEDPGVNKLVHCPAWLPDTAQPNDPCVPLALRLSQEISHFVLYNAASVDEATSQVNQVVQDISKCVQQVCPGAGVVCFGSFASGLWLPSSDIDLVVTEIDRGSPTHTSTNDGSDAISAGEPEMSTNGATMASPANPFVAPGAKELEEIAKVLAQQDWIQTSDFVASAKVPVIKLVLAGGQLRMDISIENAHTRRGIQATTVVKEYVENFPVVLPMVLVIKQFLREKGLNNAFTGGLSSYAVVLLCVHLLRRKNLLHASCSDVGQLVLDFFEYYGMVFDYTATGISFTSGEYLLPHLLLHPATASGVVQQHALMPQLVLDDPVYPDGQHNVGAGTYALARVISAFENAFYALSFHRPTKFTPTPLSQLIHWSGHETPKEG